MTNDQHHAHSAISASGLKLIDRSPAHYFAQYLDPDAKKSESTPAMIIGTAIHAAILEPLDFAKQYKQKPEGISFATKEGKAWKAENEGFNLLSFDDYAAILGITKAAHNNKSFSNLLFHEASVAEKSLFFFIDGIECKIRPDLAILPCAQYVNGVIVDVKSTVDARPIEFGKSIMNYQMCVQAAFYVDGFQAAHGTEDPPLFAWFAIEKAAPFANKLYFATESMLEYGREEYRRLLAIYAQCKASGIWPAYGDDAEMADLPAWAWRIVEGEQQEEVEIVYE